MRTPVTCLRPRTAVITDSASTGSAPAPSRVSPAGETAAAEAPEADGLGAALSVERAAAVAEHLQVGRGPGAEGDGGQEAPDDGAAETTVLRVGSVQLDLRSRRATNDERTVELTQFLARNDLRPPTTASGW